MKKIEDMSPEELRKLADEKERKMLLQRPPIKDVDVDRIVTEVENHLELLEKGYEADDHWIYETCMEAVYGKDIWKYINNLL